MIRRQFLKSAAGALATLGLPLPALAWAAPGTTKLGPAQPFDFAALKGQARALGERAYAPRSTTLPPAVEAMNWDQYQSIRFRRDHALWAQDDTRFLGQFFHLGLFFKSAVRMYEVDGGQAREIVYDPSMFDRARSGLDGKPLPADLGFAGFRLN